MTTNSQTSRPPSTRIARLSAHQAVTPTDACIPIAMLSRANVSALGLDARALFVFGFVNDRTPVFEILTSSGMPLTDAADALASLCEAGAVALAEHSTF